MVARMREDLGIGGLGQPALAYVLSLPAGSAEQRGRGAGKPLIQQNMSQAASSG